MRNIPDPLIIDDGYFKPCNLNCSYCRNSSSIYRSGKYYDDFRGIRWNQTQNLNYLQILKKIQKNSNYGAYKISGHGEITLLKNFHLFFGVDKLNILLTNGTILNKNSVKQLKDFQLIVQISLDGHTSSMNQARKTNPKKILELISEFLKNEIPVEVNTVITKYNINGLEEFFRFLDKFDSELLMCIPFPVRNFSNMKNKNLCPDLKQMEKFRKSIKEWNFFNSAPPRKYLKYMIETLEKGRKINCFLPRMILAWNYNLDILKCPCGLAESYNNLKIIMEHNINTEQMSLENEKNPLRVINESNYHHHCKNCFTHYDILNLFIKGKIDLKELERLPTYKNKELIVLIKKWKIYFKGD